MSIIQAFDTARIRADAENGKEKSLQGYLNDLLSDEERAERDAERFFATLDRQIEAGIATAQ
jgi:hypothetical protein